MVLLGVVRKHVAPAATAIALTTSAVLALTGALDGAENATIDRRFELRGSQPAPEVAVVAIDDASIHELGAWPFDRRYHAEAVDRLHDAGVKLIVYDVQFSEPSGKPRSDLALFEALGRAGGAVLAATTSDPQGNTTVLGGEQNLREIDSEAGATNAPTDRAAVIRRYSRAVGKLRSLPVAAADRAGDAPTADDFRDDGTAYIDFRGPPGSIRTVRFLDLVRGPRRPRAAARSHRRRRRERAVAAGRPRHRVERLGGDVRAGDPGQRRLDRAERQPAARPAPTWMAVLAFGLLGLAPLLLMRRRPMVGPGRGARRRRGLRRHRHPGLQRRDGAPRRGAAARAGRRLDRDPRRQLHGRGRPARVRRPGQRRSCARRSTRAPPSCATPSSRSCTGSRRPPSAATTRRASTSSASAR